MTDPSIRRQGASKDKAMFVCVACKLPRTTQQDFYFKRELDRDTKAILVQNQICSSIFDDFVSL